MHSVAMLARVFGVGLLLYASVGSASGGAPMQRGSMSQGQNSPAFEPRELPPGEQAKVAYNAGIKSIKKAKEYDLDAEKAANADKESKAKSKAIDAYNKALEQFENAVSNQPDMVEAWNYIGFANRHLGAYAEALDAYDHAIAMNPKYYEAIEYRAEAYLGLNRLDEAKTAYMELFRDDRSLSNELLTAMQKWLDERKIDAKGLPAVQIDGFGQWVSERGTIAKQTVSLGLSVPIKNWQ